MLQVPFIQSSQQPYEVPVIIPFYRWENEALRGDVTSQDCTEPRSHSRGLALTPKLPGMRSQNKHGTSAVKHSRTTRDPCGLPSSACRRAPLRASPPGSPVPVHALPRSPGGQGELGDQIKSAPREKESRYQKRQKAGLWPLNTSVLPPSCCRLPPNPCLHLEASKLTFPQYLPPCALKFWPIFAPPTIPAQPSS